MRAFARLSLGLVLIIFVASVHASTFTPLEWQQVVEHHSNPRFVGQHKHLTWVRDRNRNFIDDEIEARFRPGSKLNVIVDLNRCITQEQIKGTFARFGTVAYVSKTISAVYLHGVEFNSLRQLSELPDVAMIEWQAPLRPEYMDVASRAIEAHSSNFYSGLSAQDQHLDGTGVVVAIIGTGISDTSNSSNGFVQLTGKRVAGFDATDPNDPGDGSTNPPDITVHESAMAAMIVGSAASSGITCRIPDDGSPANCQGIAPGAKYVNVRQCTSNPPPGFAECDTAFGAKAADWVAANHDTFHINVVNMSFSETCVNDDGTSANAQQANYLVGLGMVVVVSSEKSGSTGCTDANGNAISLANGQQWVTPPGSGSMTIQVTGSDDKGTVKRTDDTIWSNYVTGPRIDFNLAMADVSALKPDIASPAQNLTIYKSGNTVFSGVSGTSPAAALVSGAAALLLQKFNLQITPDGLKQLLLNGADNSHNTAFGNIAGACPNWDTAFGCGIVNVGQALSNATAQSTDLTFTNCATGGTVGSPCNLSNGARPWDNEVDITTNPAPQFNVQTIITVNVTNRGSNTATNVLVNFGEYDYAAANPLFFHVGTQVIASIAPGQTVPVTQFWTPVSDAHQCIQVSIAYGLDSDYSNNVTQRNFILGASLYHVRVENPFFKTTKYRIDTKSSRPDWACRVNQSAFSLSADDCPFDLQVTFDAPPGTPAGETAKCQVAVYATPQGGKERLSGGVTAQTIVPRPCRVYGQVVDPKGQPVGGARVTFSRIDHLQSPTAGESKAAALAANQVAGVTNADGIFEMEITPEILQRLTIEKPKVGRGELELRPTCGLSLAGLVLKPDSIEIREIPPRVVSQR